MLQRELHSILFKYCVRCDADIKTVAIETPLSSPYYVFTLLALTDR